MSGRVLVTGGASGLGAAIVRLAAGRGDVVVSVDISPPEAVPGVIHIECDLSSREAVDRALPAIFAAGPYSQAYFNAGASATGKFEDIPPDAAARLMRLNAETPMILASTLMRNGLVKEAMCFVSSLSHFTGYPGAAVYAATKDALAAYAKSIRGPFLKAGVSVTLTCPGPLQTAHAERHAPVGADASRRMPADEAARIIVEATGRGRRLVIPGIGPKLAAFSGWLAPQTVTRQMRRLIYERLDGPVW